VKRELVSDTYILLSAPILTGLVYLLAITELVNFPVVYVFLLAIGLSLISLFLVPRYIKKAIDSKDGKKIVVSLLISVLAATPFVLALGGWVNYAS